MIAFYTVMMQFVNNICLIGSLTVSCWMHQVHEAKNEHDGVTRVRCLVAFYDL